MHETDDEMSYRLFVPSSKAPKLSSSKSAKREVDLFASEPYAKSDKNNVNLFSSERSAKASKSSEQENIFGRFLVIEEYSMSYPDLIIPGKSIKMKPKSSKKNDDIAGNISSKATSSKAGKSAEAKIAPRSIDPSSTSTLTAIDFTKAMPKASVNNEESSDAATIIYGLTTSCMLLTLYFAI